MINEPSFENFISGPLRNFFLSQAYFEKYNRWPFGERAHGSAGIVESASRLVGSRLSPMQAKAYLRVIAAPKLKGRWACPCGSGSQLKKCHIDKVLKLKSLIAAADAERLRKRIFAIEREERTN